MCIVARMRLFSSFSLSLMSVALCVSSLSAEVSVIPRPAQVQDNPKGEKAWDLLKAPVSIQASAGLESEKKALANALTLVGAKMGAKGHEISLSLDDKLPEEGYKLTISPGGKVSIVGGSPSGVFYGVQTFKQLLPAQAFSREKEVKKPNSILLSPMLIEDAPLCAWRGIMLDSARHFMPKEFVLKFIDVMALHKLNRLHWHLVDSEGWRMEIKKYPKLVEACKDFPAEYPSEDPTDKSRPAVYQYGHFHGGGYYTQEDIKEIVAYAKARHIEIMPELGFPAHAMVALTAYPEFSTTRKVPETRSNISPDLYATRPETITFLTDILDEAMALFPFEVIHFGGDEAPKGQWKKSEEVQELMKKEGLVDENQVQSWVFNKLAQHIEKQGRRPAGWEEIMHGRNMENLTKTAIIYPWLSRDNGVKSANAGHGVVHCSVGPFYLDSWQTTSPADNWSLYRGPFTLESIYTYNLFPNNLTEEGKKNILGAQGQMWSELTPKPEHVEYQTCPRMAALGELTWTPLERKDYKDFYKRLLDHTKRLDVMKVNYRYVDPLPVKSWNADDLGKKDILIDLAADELPRGKEQEAVVQFNYKTGAFALEIEKVELLFNGKTFAADEHKGNAGTKSEDHVYKLNYSFPAGAKGKVQLKVTHNNMLEKKNSQGDIVLYTGKGTELFDTRNFAGGDYPSASWTTGDTKKAKTSFRVPMDGVVKAPGDYELIFEGKKLDSPVKISQVSYQGTTGLTGKATGEVILSSDQRKGFLPISLESKDIEHGSSILFDISSAKPSSADVRVRLTQKLSPVNEKTFAWTPEMLAKGAVIAYSAPFKASQSGEVEVGFHFKGGNSGLDISSVQLLCGGKILTESKEKGFAGNNPKDNVYVLKSAEIKAGASYIIRATIAGAGGTNSKGEVLVK